LAFDVVGNFRIFCFFSTRTDFRFAQIRLEHRAKKWTPAFRENDAI